MKTSTECLERVIEFYYPPKKANKIVRCNCQGSLPNDASFIFVSGARLLTDSRFRRHTGFPAEGCDAGIYLTTAEGEPIAVCGFDLTPEIDELSGNIAYLSIRQLKGAKKAVGVKWVKWKRDLLDYHNCWAKSLIQVTEALAFECGSGVRVIPARRLPKVISGILDVKKMVVRYDISAIYRNFEPFPNDNNPKWYIKPWERIKKELER